MIGQSIKVRIPITEIIKRLRSSFENRGNEVEQIKQHIRQSPYPVIICGDFNDTPISYAYRTISKGLTDAFVNSGKGFGNTFVGPLPYFRIDFVLHDPIFKSFGFNTNSSITLSDHYPITLDFVK